jgi:uncharacterized protein
MERGSLDATLQSAGLGVDSIRQLATSVPVKLLKIPEAVVAKIGDPAFVSGVIPQRTYEGQSEDIETAAILNFLITREGVSADTVHAMTKALFSSLNQLAQTHPAASGISLRDATNGMPVPLHPGAERYIAKLISCTEQGHIGHGKLAGRRDDGSRSSDREFSRL